jgi:hypothetical protein
LLHVLTEKCFQLCWQETYGSTQMRGQLEHVVYVSVGNDRRQVGLCVPVRRACRKPGVLFMTRCGRVLQRFGENKVGKIALGVLGMTLVACLVYSAATEERQYAAYTPSAGLAERQLKQGDITKMEMQLAAKEVSGSSSDSRISTPRPRPRPRLFACRA